MSYMTQGKKTMSGVRPMAELRPRPFTRAIREIEVCNKALEVSYLSLDHYLVLLQIFDMEHPEGIPNADLAEM